MATTVDDIIDAAVARSVLNDEAQTNLVSDKTPIIAVVDRFVKQVYAAAAVPPAPGENAQTDYFAITGTLALSGSPAQGTLSSTVAWRPILTTLAGERISITSYRDYIDGVAPNPPAVYIRANTVVSCARTGDPGAENINFQHSYIPTTLDAVGDEIGSFLSINDWPSHVGDEYLISALAEYLAIKSGDRDAEELARYKGDKERAYALLMALVRGTDETARRKQVRDYPTRTTAQAIVDAAAAYLDQRNPEVINVLADVNDVLGFLNREIRRVYVIAGSEGTQDYFATSTTVTLGASPAAVPAAAWYPRFEDATGERVHVVTRRDLTDGLAELPPALVLQQNKVQTAGRTGDPVSGAVITVHYTPLPALMTALTHYVGATTADDSSTTEWPGYIGDRFLIARLVKYLASKAKTEISAQVQVDEAEATQALSQLLGVQATTITEGS